MRDTRSYPRPDCQSPSNWASQLTEPHGSLVVSASRARFPLIACLGALLFWLGQVATAVQKEDKVVRAQTVVAESFELRRPDGKAAATIRTNSEGETLLSVLTGDGFPAVELGVSRGGQPTVRFLDAKSNVRFKIGLTEEQNPVLVMNSGLLRRNTVFLSTSERGPTLSLESTGGGRIDLGLDDVGVPSLDMDAKDKNSGILLLAGDERPTAVLKGKAGKFRSTWKLLSDGSPVFTLADDKEMDRISVMVRDGSPSVSLHAMGGVVRSSWKLLENGDPAFIVKDADGKDRSVVTFGKDGKPEIR